MPTWEKFEDSQWLFWEEQIATDRWLLCFKPSGDHNPYSTRYWVDVRTMKWEPGQGEEVYIEKCNPPDEFIMLCIMHEMRKKYGSAPDDRCSEA